MDYSLINTLIDLLIMYLKHKKTELGQTVLILFFI